MCCDGSLHRRAPMRSRRLRPRVAVGRHQGVRSTSHLQGTFGSPGSRVRPVQDVAHSHSPGYSQPGRGQPVEKVGVELVATPNRAPIAPKAACLVPIGVRFEVKAATKVVFQQPGVFSEARMQDPGCEVVEIVPRGIILPDSAPASRHLATSLDTYAK